jgi:hypothetical protein
MTYCSSSPLGAPARNPPPQPTTPQHLRIHGGVVVEKMGFATTHASIYPMSNLPCKIEIWIAPTALTIKAIFK